jgi:hypothetical protein
MRSIFTLGLLALVALSGCGGPKVETPSKQIIAPDKDPTEKIKIELPKDKANP